MIILHAGLNEEQFFLWAERKREKKYRPRKRSGAKPHRPKKLPYGADVDEILTALKKKQIVGGLQKSQRTNLNVLIPSIDGVPFASSPIIAEPPETSSPPELLTWTVRGMKLDRDGIFELLGEIRDEALLARGVIAAKDLLFWARCFRFAVELVVRQKFLPGLRKIEDNKRKRYKATWEPVITGDNRVTLQNLIDSAPHSCLAVCEKNSKPDGKPLHDKIPRFIGEVLDFLVRKANHRKKQAKSTASIHEKWMHALVAPSALISASDEQLEELYRQVREWRRSLSISLDAPFKLCFRLEEPEGEDCQDLSWQVRFLIQPDNDPSLMIPVSDAWQPDKKIQKLLSGNGFNCREFLLHALGRACRLSPPVAQGLKKGSPDGYAMTIREALSFMTEDSWLLKQEGFNVILPAWFGGKGTKKKLTASAKARASGMKAKGLLSIDTVVEFDWELALGNEEITYEELKALAKLKTPLVHFRGQWVHLSAEEIEDAVRMWKKRQKKGTLQDLVRMELGVIETPGEIPLEKVAAEGPVAEFLKNFRGGASLKEEEQPDILSGELRPYQKRGYSWLRFLKTWGLGACLADDMGLGKTIQVLSLAGKDWMEGNREPVLVVCPTSVMENWKKEANRFTPDLPVTVHHGPKRLKGKKFVEKARKHALIITSYAILYRDIKSLSKVSWSGVVLDEAQNIKNPQTRQAKSARSLNAGYKIALTGTPVENHVGELWSIMEFLNPGFLGSQKEFKSRFHVPIHINRDPDAAKRLKRVTGPFILRRLKTDKSIISDLPEKMEMKVYCSITREQASLYESTANELTQNLDTLDGIRRRGMILATITKLKQICNHPRHFLGDNSEIPDRSGKTERLLEMLEEIMESGERALVFTQFSEMGEILKTYLQETLGREIYFLHGGIPRKKRDFMVESFQNNADAPPVFILSLKAGGTGLNLTKASHVFHFDRWWNPAVENQATDRVYRIGQQKNVQVHKFVCAGTIEERIDEMIESKLEIAESVLGAGESWITELSNNDIRDILTLGSEATGG